jgi:antitoxin CptB
MGRLLVSFNLDLQSDDGAILNGGQAWTGPPIDDIDRAMPEQVDDMGSAQSLSQLRQPRAKARQLLEGRKKRKKNGWSHGLPDGSCRLLWLAVVSNPDGGQGKGVSMGAPDDLDNQRKRLIFRSWHRGTREMDLIMGRFAEQAVPSMTEAELDVYARLLEENDPDIYDWLCGRQAIPESSDSAVLRQLIDYSFKKPR